MIGCLKKDFIIFLNYYNKSIIMFAIIAVVCAYFSSIIFMFIYSAFIISSLAVSSIAYDQQNKEMEFLFTLPINKSIYVKSKYILSIILTLASLIFCSIVYLFIAYIKPDMAIVPFELILSIGIAFACSMLYISLLTPLYLKLGAEKARIFSVVISVVIFILLLSVANINLPFLDSINLSASGIVAIVTVIVLIIMFVSLRISEKVIVISNADY